MSIRYKKWMILGVAAALLAVAASPALAGNDKSTSGVFWFAEPEKLVGNSHLWRGDEGVRMLFKTSELGPREAVTIWWVVFNEPENCSAPCNEDDIFIDGDPTKGLNVAGIEAADIVAGYATGKVGSSGGNVNLNATLGEGEIGPEVIFGDGALLKDARRAEIHLVVRSHGPAKPGLEEIQIGSFAGGCEVFRNPPAIPTSEGECADIQFAVHQP